MNGRLFGQNAKVIIAEKSGRLGNRLFLSAYFMANSMANGYRLINPALGEYASFFEGSSRDPMCHFPAKGGGFDPDMAEQLRDVSIKTLPFLARLVESSRILDIRETHDATDRTFDLNGDEYRDRIAKGGVLFARGWKFRDHKNLLGYHREITDYFTPVITVRESAESVVRQARSKGNFLVGVHVRQGDYRNWKNGIHYFETEQYAYWMKEVVHQYPDRKPAFLVCASDPLDIGLFGNLAVTMGPGDVVADLHALSLCDAIMAPPSTFSMWASFRGRVPLAMLEQHLQKITPQSFVLHDRV